MLKTGKIGFVQNVNWEVNFSNASGKMESLLLTQKIRGERR